MPYTYPHGNREPPHSKMTIMVAGKELDLNAISPGNGMTAGQSKAFGGVRGLDITIQRF